MAMTTTQPRTTDAPVAAPRRGAGRSILTVLGIVLAVVGGLSVLSYALRESQTDTETFTDPVTAISIDTDAGSVEIVAGDVDDVEVEVTRTWGFGGAPDATAKAQGDELVLEGDCSQGWLFWWTNMCSVAYVVTTPADVAVTVETQAGSVDVVGVAGGANVTTSAGSIDVEDVTGDVRLRTSAGGIDATVASETVEAVSSAGSVTVIDTVVPQSITARSSAGEVLVEVPDEVYRVEAETSAGSETVEVDTSAEATRTITAISSAGDVTVRRGSLR